MQNLCAALRAGHGCGEFPVDVWRIAEGLGVRVVERAWKGIPHAVCFYPSRLVILNAARPLHARRFDLAHELGHYVFEPQRYHQKVENQFAAELLMPSREVRMEVLICGAGNGLAQHFGVSDEALGYRLRELGLL